MIRFTWLLLACAASLAAISFVPLLGEDKPEAKRAGGEGNIMEDWKKLAQPGVEHSLLAKNAGTWTVTATCWKNGPDKPITMAGTSEQKMLYDRYLHEEFSIGEGENHMAGSGLIAFDNSNKQYQAMYVGDMGTALCVMNGEKDAKTGSITFTSERTEKGLNGLNIKGRVVVTAVVENRYIVTIYQTIGDQPEAKFLELQYSRK